MQHDQDKPDGLKDQDLTPKDISNLCTNLQTVIENLPTSEEISPTTMPIAQPLPHTVPSPTISLSRADSTTPPFVDAKESPLAPTDCPCQHVFSSENPSHCALCERVLPVVDDLLKENAKYCQEIELLKALQQEHLEKMREYEQQAAESKQRYGELEKQMLAKTNEIESLHNDLAVLNDKYTDEIERVAEIEHAKELVEEELEDLSRHLFEEANGMVANEKRERYELELANRRLREQLEDTQTQLAAEKMQLSELRLKFEKAELDDQKRHSFGHVDTVSDTDPDKTAALDLSVLFCTQLRQSANAPNPPEGIDPMMLSDFEEFLKVGRTLSFKKLQSTSFIKHCLAEDVEPCLRFGLHSRLSVRKLVEAIVDNKCYIEDTPPGFVAKLTRLRSPDNPLRISTQSISMWERFNSGDIPFSGCQACGRDTPLEDLPYRFRTSFVDDWACIDRHCRDRLVSVCEFYVFIRNVWQGYYSSRSTTSLYYELMRLRLQMLYARLGVLPWVLRCLGVNGDAVGKATAPYQFALGTPETTDYFSSSHHVPSSTLLKDTTPQEVLFENAETPPPPSSSSPSSPTTKSSSPKIQTTQASSNQKDDTQQQDK